MIRTLLFILILTLGFTFMLKNTEPQVTLQYFFGMETSPIPVYHLVTGAFITGMLLAGVLVFPEWLRLRLEVRRQRKAIQRIEEEMERIRPSAPVMAPMPRVPERREDSGEGGY